MAFLYMLYLGLVNEEHYGNCYINGFPGLVTRGGLVASK